MPSSRSALGVLLVLTAALAGLAPPALAADKTLTVSYTCSGGPFSNASLSVPVVVPDSATGTFDAEWAIPALTLRTAATAATQVQVNGKLVVNGGTHADLVATGASVAAGATSAAASTVTSQVTVTSTTEVTVKPSTETGSLKLSLASAPSDVTSCTTSSTQGVTVTVGPGGGDTTGGDIVLYTCKPTSGAEQEVDVKVTLTLPTTNPAPGQQFTIGWKGVYESGAELEAPNGLPTTGLKMYAYASISGLTGLTSATGVGELSGVTVGQPIPLPASVDMKTTSQQAGTATVKPASINFGLQPTSPLIECEPDNSDLLKTYTLTIGAGGSTSTPTPTPTTTTPTPTPTPTPTDDDPADEPSADESRTPKDGVATGAGGTAGPDGRLFVLTGSALVLAAGVGGLLLRRRTARY
ncbi:hypothetical protein [Nonomuraea sp. NPDC003214]